MQLGININNRLFLRHPRRTRVDTEKQEVHNAALSYGSPPGTRIGVSGLLSYLHGYHAGNFADVHKHCTVMLVLQKLLQKNTPISYIDTHAGSGVYTLDDALAEKTGEYKLGIGALEQAYRDGKGHNPTAKAYLELLELFRQKKRATHGEQAYPGSPAIAQQLMRDQDFGILIELHTTEIGKLKQTFKRDSRLSIHHRNGFEGLAALTPPKTPRGLALIDPSYELTSDYHELFKHLDSATQRWSTGVFAIWYPILAGEKNHSSFIKRKLGQLNVQSTFVAELQLKTKEEGSGMIGSGMALINAPWKLDTELAALMKDLEIHLGDNKNTSSYIEWIKEKA